jgi:SAM-dependent methyltransferase
MASPVTNYKAQYQVQEGSPADLIRCPLCHGILDQIGLELSCRGCSREFPFRHGFPDLIVDERFNDPTTVEKIQYEERSNADLTQNYLVPLFRQLWPDHNARLLSLGCGTGIDVDLLTREGFECIGIDCGNRTKVWEGREQRSHLILANGKHLPFPNQSFDGVFCGCVFPHVGVVGDSSQVTAQYNAERSRLAGEIGRVLKSNGKVIVSSPNRLFPLDLFHGREEGSLRPKWNWPGRPFLLSAGDYARLFRPSGFTQVIPLPVGNYWGFIRSKHSLRGWMLGMPVRSLFWIVSQVPLLRTSPLNPWLVLLLARPH